MTKTRDCTILFLSIAGAFLAGSWYNQRTVTPTGSTGDRKILYYVDPMHPAYQSDKPGIAPDCGMQLEPVYAGGGPAAPGANGVSSQPPGALNISAEKQQRIGVRLSRVEMLPGTHTLRLFGRVAPDETRVYKLIAGIEGFISQISAITTGSQVQKDQWLATFSSPDARAPIQGYLVTLNAMERQKPGGEFRASATSTRIATDRLRGMGMSSVQIEEIRRTRDVPTDIRILSPAAGFVLARNVSPSQRFEKGAEWYRIADLSRVWILADVFQRDAKYIRPGQRARVTLPDEQTVFSARVSEVLPQFDPNSRTLKVRLETENPGYALRPDMFVDVDLPVALPRAITVPVDALVDSGLNKTVFVERGEGFFEPRQVETGWRFGDRVQIVKGLEPGQRIVTSGNFLLDSESRMKQASAGIQGELARDPACGMDVDQLKAKAAGRMSEYRGRVYYFCGDSCKRKFEQAPDQYVEGAGTSRVSYLRAPARSSN